MIGFCPAALKPANFIRGIAGANRIAQRLAHKNKQQQRKPDG